MVLRSFWFIGVSIFHLYVPGNFNSNNNNMQENRFNSEMMANFGQFISDIFFHFAQ